MSNETKWEILYDKCLNHFNGDVILSYQSSYILPFYECLLHKYISPKENYVIEGLDYDIILLESDKQLNGVSITKLGDHEWLNFGLCDNDQVVAGLIRIESNPIAPKIMVEASLSKVPLKSWRGLMMTSSYEFCIDDLLDLGELLLSLT